MVNILALGAGLCFSGLTTAFWGILTDNEGPVLIGILAFIIGFPVLIWEIAERFRGPPTRRGERREGPPDEGQGPEEGEPGGEAPGEGEAPPGEEPEEEPREPEEGEPTPPAEPGEEPPTPESPEEEITDPDIHVITVEPESGGVLHKVYADEVVELRATAKNRFIEGGFFEFHTLDDKVIEKIKIHNKGKLVKERVKIPGKAGTTIKIHVKLRLKGEKKHTEGLPGIENRHEDRKKRIKAVSPKVKIIPKKPTKKPDKGNPPESADEIAKKYKFIFGFGSLMWKPEPELILKGKHQNVVKSYKATLRGFARAFNKKSIKNWGTKTTPGPTLGLEKQKKGECIGVLFQIKREDFDQVLGNLFKKETISSEFVVTTKKDPDRKRGIKRAREGKTFKPEKGIVEVKIKGKKVRVEAVFPWNRRTGEFEGYYIEQKFASSIKIANMVRAAKGTSGTCEKYVKGIHKHLRDVGVKDPAVEGVIKALN